MSNHKTRLNKLEARRHDPRDIHVIYFEEGIATQADKAPQVIGKTIAEVTELYAAQNSAKFISVVYTDITAKE